MKSSDLELFRNIAESIDPYLYYTLQNPDSEFIDEVESGEWFVDKDIEYDFEEKEDTLGVSLRYYQRLALYFTKYYFENIYEKENSNKLTYWMATGSGKTIIMKANILDYLEYIKDKNPSDVEIIITSPLKELINQLQVEMGEFFSSEAFRDFRFTYKIETTQALIEKYKTESHEMVGDSQYRLLLVDEAHIGLSSSESGAFVRIRDELTKHTTNSFMFEYSATFYDVTKKEQIKEYAKRVVYEYDYGKFYNDKYGKDFLFGVVKKDEIPANEDEDIKQNLDKNLEEFSKKIDAFYEFNKISKTKFANRPLLIMAGNTVSASKEKSSENEENSDISKVISYLAKLLDNQKSKYEKVFHSSHGILHIFDTKNNSELLLSFGEKSKPFGLITVGDSRKFLENSNISKLIEEKKIVLKPLKFLNEDTKFENIDYESSPINILIGSRKFSAGWNSFRVSQICLINFGTGKGSTIVQIFGRGVRLKGLNGDGKRNVLYYVDENSDKTKFREHSKEVGVSKDKFEYLKYLETLFVYSLKSTYLINFVEEDTDIYQKSITVTKKVKISEDKKNRKLPIFYIDKTKIEDDKFIKVDKLELKDDILEVTYGDTKVSIKLPIILNLFVQKDVVFEYESFKWLKEFVDVVYLQKEINKRVKKANIQIDGFSFEFVWKLIESKKVIIKYDLDISNPKQFQKLLFKIIDTLILKIKNSIVYKESNSSYKYIDNISSDDCIKSYDVKFILQRDANKDEISKRLNKKDDYMIFIESILNHYYQPLALDVTSKTKDVYKYYQKCYDKDYNGEYDNIFEFAEIKGYFKDIEAIKISPDKLDSYELKFVCDLQSYIKEHSLDVVILRNRSKGNIGLINDEEGDVFYPDFILWYKDKISQEHIIFVDPKGISYPETKWKVCYVPYKIKEIEEKINKDIKFHSFVISNTKKANVKWEPISKIDKKFCDVFYNLLFFEDEDYISKIFQGLDKDYHFYSDFIEHLHLFDDETKKELLDEEKRTKHLEVIDKIVENEGIERGQAILLYFLIWNKKDRIKEAEEQGLIDDTKELIKDELLSEIIPEVLLGAMPYGSLLYKVVKKVLKK